MWDKDGCKGPGQTEGEAICGRPIVAQGLCSGHYQAHVVRGKPLAPLRRRAPEARDILSGVRIAPEVEHALSAEARKRRIPVATVAAEVLEAWAKRRK